MTESKKQTRWIQKAMAFVTRSHRHLWGKNNEEPLAFLFEHGLKNSFAKQMLLGWNKFGQNRPLKNWGVNPETTGGEDTLEKLFLPAGIVVPYIIEQRLQSVFIHPFEPSVNERTILIPGSQTSSLILGQPSSSVFLIQDILDGLFLFQEIQDGACIIIHPDLSFMIGKKETKIMQRSEHCMLFKPTHSAKKALSKKDIEALHMVEHFYDTKEDLLSAAKIVR